jgi:hypothetical protein
VEHECEYLAKCPIFARFSNEGLRNVWIALYCRGAKKEECARKKLKDAGAEVPLTLLPSGEHLPSLGTG